MALLEKVVNLGARMDLTRPAHQSFDDEKSDRKESVPRVATIKQNLQDQNDYIRKYIAEKSVVSIDAVITDAFLRESGFTREKILSHRAMPAPLDELTEGDFKSGDRTETAEMEEGDHFEDLEDFNKTVHGIIALHPAPHSSGPAKSVKPDKTVKIHSKPGGDKTRR